MSLVQPGTIASWRVGDRVYIDENRGRNEKRTNSSRRGKYRLQDIKVFRFHQKNMQKIVINEGDNDLFPGCYNALIVHGGNWSDEGGIGQLGTWKVAYAKKDGVVQDNLLFNDLLVGVRGEWNEVLIINMSLLINNIVCLYLY